MQLKKTLNLTLITDNQYLFYGVRLICSSGIQVKAYSTYTAIGKKFGSQEIVIIDMDSWERSHLGETESLKLILAEKQKNILIATDNLFNKIILNLLYKGAVIVTAKDFVSFINDYCKGEKDFNSMFPITEFKCLTGRESQVVLMHSCGIEIKTICNKLGINTKTFYCHMKSALNKTGSRKLHYLHYSIYPYFKDITLKVESMYSLK